MGRCGCSSGNGGRNSSKRTSAEIGVFKLGWWLSGSVAVEHDPTWPPSTERSFNAIAPPQIASDLFLFRNRFDLYYRIGPIHCASGNCLPLVQGHEVFKGKYHNSLGEELRIPFGEPNFPSIPKSFIPVGA